MGILNQDFKYTNAADSAKPGYLRRKFEKVRREMREKAEQEKASSSTVRTLKTAKGTK